MVGLEYFKPTTGDVNAFLFLFFDNFSSLVSILGAMVALPKIVLGFTPPDIGAYEGPNGETYTAGAFYTACEKVVWWRAVPGIAFALIVGNLWYAAMAYRLAKKEGRSDVTALPYGINTPAGFLTVYQVMLPLMFAYNPAWTKITPDDFATRAWQGACAANFMGGIFEICGTFLGPLCRKYIPRGALLTPIAGVGFVWLGFNPVIEVMREPIVGLLPLMLVFSSFFAADGKGFYKRGVPMALIIIIIGTSTWWMGLARHDTEGRELNDNDKMSTILEYYTDEISFKNEMWAFKCLGFTYLKGSAIMIVFPVALASFIETIENVELAALEGDSFNVIEAMVADGMGTLLGACFGAPLPTTCYIGHSMHKKAGARSMYSIFNGTVYFILLLGGFMPMLFYFIDPFSPGCILVAVGLEICKQAFAKSQPRHYPAICVGLFFIISEMVYFDHFNQSIDIATRSIGRMKGVQNMAPGGGILCSLVIPAILCNIIDAKFLSAAMWCFLAAFCSLFGMMHGANYVHPDGMLIDPIAMGTGKDYFTTDLGALTISTPTELQYLNYADCKDGDGNLLPREVLNASDFLRGLCISTPYKWQYKVDDIGYGGDGANNALFFSASKLLDGTGHFIPPQYNTPQIQVYNEGWRFMSAYLVAAFIWLGHFAVQKMTNSCTMINDMGAIEEGTDKPGPSMTKSCTSASASVTST